MDGFGCDKMSLCIFFFNRSPARVRAAKAVWEQKNDVSLLDRLVSELSGEFESLILTMLRGKRMAPDADDDAEADLELAVSQAEGLHEKGGELDYYVSVLCNNSPAQNKAVADAFEDKFDRSLFKHIKKSFGGYVSTGLQMLLSPAMDHRAYAAMLHTAFKGWGAKHQLIIRIIGTLEKEDALEVASAYERKYQTPLRESLRQECSGRYKKLAIAWVTVPDALETPNEPLEVPDEEVTAEEEAEDADDAEAEGKPEADEPEPDSDEAEPEPSPEPAGSCTFYTSPKFEGIPTIYEDGRKVKIWKRATVFMGDSFGRRNHRIKLRLTEDPLHQYCHVGAAVPSVRMDLSLANGSVGFAVDGTVRVNGRKITGAAPERAFGPGDELELVYKHESQALFLYINGRMKSSVMSVNNFHRPAVSAFTTTERTSYHWELLESPVGLD